MLILLFSLMSFAQDDFSFELEDRLYDLEDRFYDLEDSARSPTIINNFETNATCIATRITDGNVIVTCQ